MNDLKDDIIELILVLLDESQLLTNENSYVEDYKGLVHYAGDRGDRYFKIELIEVDQKD
jgi:hypothetical protein